MKNFFETVKNSVWGPKFYAVMDSRTTREALSYFLSLLFLVAFIMTVAISIYAVPDSLSFLRKSAEFLAVKYPADLKITLGGGLASTTPAGVRVFPITPDFFGSKEIGKLSAEGINNILVIDTETNFENRKQFEGAKTMALVTRDSLVTLKQPGGFEVKTFPKNFNAVVTKPLVEKWSAKILSIFKFILPLLVAFGFLVLYIMNAVMYLILSAFSALILWAISSLAKRKGHYRQFFNVALHAVTFPIALDLVIFVVSGRGLSSVSIVALTVVVWAINVKIWKKAEVPEVRS